MRVSVVIAAHNEGPSLWRTVGSCIETCTELDHEIVVADDASTDNSIEQVLQRFPQVRVVRNDEREGASPAKALGAQNARGEVLVFLDGHTKPEYGAIPRLVEDVGRVKGEAVIVPQIPALDAERWKNNFAQSGNGYKIDLLTLACGWVPLEKMHVVQVGRKQFYESPALIGCALAVHRELYEKLWGFDRHMRLWGVEDLDFGLKCWLMGGRVLHDPQAVIGHRFRAVFDNYSVPPQNVAVNQLRLARKNFTQSVWEEWLDRARRRQPERLLDHPEGLWAHTWQLFEADRESVERERAYLLANRPRDEFWYADRFDLAWPALGAGKPKPSIKLFEGEGSPSPPPPGKCRIYSISPATITVPVMTPQVFTARGYELDDIEWDTGGKGNPEGQADNPFYTQFDQPGTATVTAKCPDGPSKATSNVTAVKVQLLEYFDPMGNWTHVPATLYVHKGTTVRFRALKNPSTSPVWPKGKPVWGGEASGSHVDEVAVTFNNVSAGLGDLKTVTAECGNQLAANVLVFQLVGEFEPIDDFPGRSKEKYGLRERIDLDFHTQPAGVNLNQIGGKLTWKLVAGTGSLALRPAGKGTFDMPNTPGTAGLQLTIDEGISKGMGTPVYTKTAVAPDGGKWTKISNTWHCANTYSIGMCGDIYVTSPKDVSFWKIFFTEGTCQPKPWGDWFKKNVPKLGAHAAWGQCFAISKVGDGQGGVSPSAGLVIIKSKWGNVDGAWFERLVSLTYPAMEESFNWPIPWQYGLSGTDRDPKLFLTMNQTGTVGPGGAATISKGGGAGENKASDGESLLVLPAGKSYEKIPACPAAKGEEDSDMRTRSTAHAVAVGIGILGAAMTAPAGAVAARPSEEDVETYVRERDELGSLEAKPDYAGLERLAVAIYENREHPIKDRTLRSQLLAEMIIRIGQPPRPGFAGLNDLARRYARELLSRPDELLPESEAEIVWRTPWVPEVLPGTAGSERENERLAREFVKNDRARVVRYYFKALQRLEKAIDPSWKPGQAPAWLPGKPQPGFIDGEATWKHEQPGPNWLRLPEGLPFAFHQMGEPSAQDIREIPDPALRAAYIRVAEANEAMENNAMEQESQRRELSEFVPMLECDIGFLYANCYPSVPGARGELEGIFREFKVDPGMRARILNKISEIDNDAAHPAK